MTIKSLFAPLSAIALSLGVAACGGDAEAPVETAPEAPAGISVTDGRMTLPAVSGNPGAVYFTITNGGDEQVMIREAYVMGAGSAMMHETSEWSRQVDMQELFQVPVPAGGETVFAPGGKHVMAFDLDDTLAAGGETEVTLTFTGGDKVSFPATLLAPGTDAASAEAAE